MRNLLSLIRFPNLLIMVLSQSLVQACLLFPDLPLLEALHFKFWLLTLSTAFIGAAGYVINDYYDIKIDTINKPDKIIVGRELSRRKAMFGHLALSAVGVVIGFLLSLKVGLVNLGAVLLLWGYSADLKKRPLSGNITIAFLAASMVLVVAVLAREDNLGVWAYAAFAFVSTLIREIIKDLEDMKGDAVHGCRTLPIVAGIQQTRIVLYALLILFYTLVLAASFYRQNDTFFGVYLGLAVLAPGLMIGVQLRRSDRKRHFARLSLLCKFMMLAGTISMLFFRF
ncbi:geranylgeranylglycerol-phosphate geranylgeranyltransferase [Adhaeribacter sp. BT258]|uniref:Geranylgeranylglycerol-phosphate geranylgeranyltransferase n=1 Tax=Adhaeribacter terrigena TaxID=2793070 RepID=A0ABS1C549_9BACT|nr:geranylgeranylglycerol-phosphate geranylgeranyltransferase [Adhaeribacter terrigena]MBK0404516.1 geranylgeranylglycerol-phosphate geranylgeranyltransferase [Adhaeribacter terrigena]